MAHMPGGHQPGGHEPEGHHPGGGAAAPADVDRAGLRYIVPAEKERFTVCAERERFQVQL